MTGLIWQDWTMLAVSLFNALLLLWLGLTVFLNAERREWGIWLSSIGLLLGSVFFTSHSAILVQGINEITPGLNFWWRVGWISVVGLPFIWYVVVLWYTGYWDYPAGKSASRNDLNQRQRNWFALVMLFGLVLTGLLIFTDLLPSLSDLVVGQIPFGKAISGITGLILVYMLCIVLSIDAIRHPEKSRRLMGELARARARRWLMATSVLLLGVSLLVGGVMVWIIWGGIFQPSRLITFGWIDLGISVLIGVSVLLLGQAIVSYEVFTGKTLPRRGLTQYWLWTVVLAVGFSMLISGSLVLGLRPIYTLLLSAMVMITFFALLTWHSFAERERLIKSLRPFASSQQVTKTFLKKGTSSSDLPQQEHELEAPFQALCENVLESESAGLFPYGQMAMLTGQPSFFPPGAEFHPHDLAGIEERLQDGEMDGLSLEPGEVEGAIYAVPLWRENGLSGMILLGQKQGGRPYTKEEIEITQATGEKLIDARASAEIISRLISFQRQHLVAGQVIDQRVRRELHDDILPQVHTTMLDLAAGDVARSENGKVLALLDEIHKQLSNLLQSLPTPISPDIERAGLVGALRNTVEIEMAGAFDEVEWQIDGQFELLARDLPSQVAEVVYSAVREGLRNAARHGRGENDNTSLCLQITLEVKEANQLRIILEDNGVGFENRYSISENALETQLERSNGHGLTLYSTLMAIVGGSLNVSSHPREFTRVILELPREKFVT
jgi:signal transduction histidine kinase